MRIRDVDVKSIIYVLEAAIFSIRTIKQYTIFSFVLSVYFDPFFLVKMKNVSRNRYLLKDF